MKADKIKERLIGGKSLPEAIYYAGGGGHIHSNSYYTKRIEINETDSVDMVVTINDSLMFINFNERHKHKGVWGLTYNYALNKAGVINWAYHTESDVGSMEPVINLNDDVFPKVQPDKKTLELYESKIKMSLDELYDMLFKSPKH